MKKIILSFVVFITPFQAIAQDKYLDIQEVTSTKGISAWLVEDPSIPVIAMRFAFRNAGAKNEAIDKQGLARLASNTMDEGAGNLDSYAFQKTLLDESITLQFSATRDHFTGNLKTLTQNKGKAFNLLKLALTQPRFDDDPVKRMKTSNISRIKASMTNPRWIAARLQNDVIFEDHPYAFNSGGTLSSLEALTSEDLRAFSKTLGKNQLVISVAGDINAEELKTVLDNIFSELPDIEDKTSELFKLKNTGKTYVYTKDIPQSVIEIAQDGIRRSDEDYYAAQLMNFILGESGFGSRLMTEIREKKGLTYGIYSYLRQYEETDTLQVSTSTANENVPEMLSLIHQEWDGMKTNPVDEKELSEAKSYLIGSLPLSLSSTDSIANVMLALQLEGLPIDYLDQRAAYINAVSAEDIQKAAVKRLATESLTTIIVGNPKDLGNSVIISDLPNVE